MSGGGLKLGDGGAMCRRGFEGLHGDLEAVDHLAGAAGVDGVLGEAVDDGGKGDEDAGAILDGGNLHAGDFRVDEDAAVIAVARLYTLVFVDEEESDNLRAISLRKATKHEAKEYKASR
jgi:hypothetical protein